MHPAGPPHSRSRGGASGFVAVLLLALALAHIRYLWFVCDDAYITYRYASNLAHGLGPPRDRGVHAARDAGVPRDGVRMARGARATPHESGDAARRVQPRRARPVAGRRVPGARRAHPAGGSARDGGDVRVSRLARP